MLIHYDIPAVDPAAWRLAIGGAVERPLTLTLDDLQRRPPSPPGSRWSAPATAGPGWSRGRSASRGCSRRSARPSGPARRWRRCCAEAGLAPDAVDVVFTGADHGVERGVEQDYARGLPLAEALRPDVLLAYAMNGAPLPPQHGSPLRLVVPGWYGMAQVKWLTRIDVLTEPFAGYQNATAYRLKVDADDDGEPVTRIRPRALLAPPGFPDFMTRERFVRAGPVPLPGGPGPAGRRSPRVEVSTDGGADLGRRRPGARRPGASFAWRAWTYDWDAHPGPHELLVAGHRRAAAPSRSSRTGTGRAWPTTSSSGCRSRSWTERDQCAGGAAASSPVLVAGTTIGRSRDHSANDSANTIISSLRPAVAPPADGTVTKVRGAG